MSQALLSERGRGGERGAVGGEGEAAGRREGDAAGREGGERGRGLAEEGAGRGGPLIKAEMELIRCFSSTMEE